MIQLIDRALEDFLRHTVPLPTSDVDVSFEAPDKSWGSGITRPTINAFLWDLRRDAGRLVSGRERAVIDETEYHRAPPVAVEFQYLVTAWASSQSDEHQLLGTVLRAVIGRRQIPESVVPPALSQLLEGVVRIELASSKDGANKDLWRAFDGQLKPALQISIGAYLLSDPFGEVAEPPREVEVGVDDRQEPTRSSRRRRSIEELPRDAADGG